MITGQQRADSPGSIQIEKRLNFNHLILAQKGFQFPIHELAQRVPQHGDALMTIAQQLEQKGIQKGIQLGRQEGRNEGKLEGKLEVARTMLQNGIDRNTVMKMTGLTENDLAQIRH